MEERLWTPVLGDGITRMSRKAKPNSSEFAVSAPVCICLWGPIVITSYNLCNFTGRNDASPATHAHEGFPWYCYGYSVRQSPYFQPSDRYSLDGADGRPFKFNQPTGDELPSVATILRRTPINLPLKTAVR